MQCSRLSGTKKALLQESFLKTNLFFRTFFVLLEVEAVELFNEDEEHGRQEDTKDRS